MNNSRHGEIIQVEIMEPISLTVESAVQRFDVPTDMLAAVLAGSRPITQELVRD
ncbi:hypothetical protein PT7_0595 [Pusillimonas sp. T7-7]|uniref:hypothetical protein n=1 Tax=Pusillimonas sp. (strain T7-7) TaxID=1007105 RepID=UPI0002085671|nr:hypothetical protein [Pusillimonas sp. T7-7]AEC19135.1 hypothetical protein PT7_0595 [Pusillimonas sp. T7-7]